MSAARDRFKPNTVVLREVGLRDGLQLVRQYPNTVQKKEWIRREHAAGVKYFEAGSFLPASRFPQFADVREIVALGRTLPDTYLAALTLNERAVADALATGVDEMIFVVSATEGHSEANTRRTRRAAVEMLGRIRAMIDDADTDGTAPLLSAGIAMAFGCSIEGDVPMDEVLRLVDDCLEAGADIIALADTVGYAGPRQVAALTAATHRRIGGVPLGMHLHDTRGMAIANASAALDHGAVILDGSLGGLGGCPFAPGASGNVAFEDLVFLCETKGFSTGIDLEALVEVRSIVQESMPDEPLYGSIARAGVPKGAAWKSARLAVA